MVIAKMNLSFAGCGFLGIYHVGVAVCFRKYAPHLLLNKISGASAGAIAACCLLCDLPLGDITSDVLRVCTEARSRSLGPFSPSFNVQDVLIEGLERFLPEDAHIRVNGRLFVSLTRVYDGKNVIISHFDSKKELLQVLMASAFVPIFSGIIPPKFKGIRYMDGGFSDNLPTLDENTITVSPFCGESDICPRDESSQLFHINIANTSIELSKQNIYRFTRILFPPKPEILSNMCKQGFDDALRFLHRNDLINCTRCLSVQSTFVVSKAAKDDENTEYDPECHECKIHRQEAIVSNMPETVLAIFQDAIDTANKGLLNWVFKHRGMKLLSILSLPYLVPADIVYATITKLMAAAPSLGDGLWETSKIIMDQLSSILTKVNTKRQEFSENILCQLAITEYGGDAFDIECCHHQKDSNKMNLNFTLNIDESELSMDNQNPKMKFATKKILSRKPSFNVDVPMDDDTFDHILQVTAQHEAIMAYYYMDENNKVKVTEIFDVTDSDNVAMQTPYERQINNRLEFENDWDNNEQIYLDELGSAEEMSDFSEEDLLDRETSNIFSDPESEWNAPEKHTKIRADELEDYNDQRHSDLRPESDQKKDDVYKPCKYPSYNFQSL